MSSRMFTAAQLGRLEMVAEATLCGGDQAGDPERDHIIAARKASGVGCSAPSYANYFVCINKIPLR